MASQFGTAWEQRLDFERLRAYRIDRANEALSARHLDGVIVFAHDNIRYLTGYRPLMWETGYVTRNAAVLPREGQPVVLAHAGDLSRAIDGMPWMGKGQLLGLGSMEDPGIAKTIVESDFRDIVQKAGIATGRIGLDGTTFFTTGYLRSALPNAHWADASETMKEARSVKCADELRLIAIAAEIADGGLWTALQHVDCDGVSEQEVAAEGVGAIFRLGAEYLPVNPTVASGLQAEYQYGLATNKLIGPTEFVVLDFAAMHDGYCARIARTTVVGRPSSTQRQVYRVVYDSLRRGVDSCRAGSGAATVAKRMGEGLPEPGDHGHVYARGAGVGMSVNELPRVGRESDSILQAGMVVALEVGAHLPGVGGVRLSETVAVTDSGPHVLTNVEFERALL